MRSRSPAALRAPAAMQDFLLSYPRARSAPSASAQVNLAFYQNRAPASPSPWKIDELHEKLAGNYDELEGRHDFIQWIFPIRERGVNWQAQPLQVDEIGKIRADPVAMERLSTSYSMMLDFYGMRLLDASTGQISRAPHHKKRYANLLRNAHNYLRITRILKSNSELGREYLNAPWLLFFLVEQGRGELNAGYLRGSMDGFWRWAIRNAEEREWVVGKIDRVRKGEQWTEEDYVAALERRKTTGSFAEEPPARESEE